MTVVQALVTAKGISITAAAEENLPPETVRNGRFEDQTALVAAFKAVRKRAKLNAYLASINIPAHFCTMKEFAVPEGYFSNDNDNLDWEIGQHVTGAISSYKTGFIEIDAVETKKRSLVVASRRGLIDERTKFLIAAGLSPCAVEPDILSTHNALAVIFLDFPSERFLIVDISAPFTSFGMVVDGVFLSGGYFPTPQEVISGEDGSFELARALTQAFNGYFAIQGFALGKKGPEMMIASGIYAEPFLVSQVGNYLNVQVYDSDPFKSSWVDTSKLKTAIPWHRLIKPFGLAMRSPYD